MILLQQTVISVLAHVLQRGRYGDLHFDDPFSSAERARSGTIAALADQYQRLMVTMPIRSYRSTESYRRSSGIPMILSPTHQSLPRVWSQPSLAPRSPACNRASQHALDDNTGSTRGDGSRSRRWWCLYVPLVITLAAGIAAVVLIIPFGFHDEYHHHLPLTGRIGFALAGLIALMWLCIFLSSCCRDK